MEFGTIAAIVWCTSIVILVSLALWGSRDMAGNAQGPAYVLAICLCIVATVACVWVSSGIHVDVSL